MCRESRGEAMARNEHSCTLHPFHHASNWSSSWFLSLRKTLKCDQFQLSCSSAWTLTSLWCRKCVSTARFCVMSFETIKLDKSKYAALGIATDSFACDLPGFNSLRLTGRSLSDGRGMSPSCCSFMCLLHKAKWVCHRISVSWTPIWSVIERSKSVLGLISNPTQIDLKRRGQRIGGQKRMKAKNCNLENPSRTK